MKSQIFLYFPSQGAAASMVEETIENSGPRVEVKTLSDRVITFPIDDKLVSVCDVKRLVSEREAIPQESIILIGSGKILSDDLVISSLPSYVQPSTQIKTTTIHWFYMEPVALTLNPIEAAKDWDAKNRLRCFVGIYYLSQRNFTLSADLLTECLPTFQEGSFMEFKDLVRYAVISAVLVFERPDLNKKVLKSPEVLEVIDQLPELKALVDSFYLCNYSAFFQALAVVEDLLKTDWIVGKHTAYIVKELRIRAYAQILQSYRSLSIASMAIHFGVSEDFIDREVSRFIAAGRLNCVIDKVAGVVVTNSLDRRNSEYHSMLKQGDALLSKIHKLSRIVSQ